MYVGVSETGRGEHRQRTTHHKIIIGKIVWVYFEDIIAIEEHGRGLHECTSLMNVIHIDIQRSQVTLSKRTTVNPPTTEKETRNQCTMQVTTDTYQSQY